MVDHIKAKAAALALAGIATLVVSVSSPGVDSIKKHEGVRTTAYADPYYGWKLPTICYGSTAGVTKGQKATLAECDQRLRKDIQAACDRVKRDLQGTGVLLTQGEQDAYCSFAFNTGYFKYQRNGKTTSIYKNLVAGKPYEACQALKLYTYSNGVKSKGLINRREHEAARCVSDFVKKPNAQDNLLNSAGRPVQVPNSDPVRVAASDGAGDSLHLPRTSWCPFGGRQRA